MKITPSTAVSNSSIGPLPNATRARMKKAATALEGVWLTQVLQAARPKGGMLDKSFASSAFQDMLSQQLGQTMADSGVVGLADKMTNQLLHTDASVQPTPSAPKDRNVAHE